jgi:hypothetical protein
MTEKAYEIFFEKIAVANVFAIRPLWRKVPEEARDIYRAVRSVMKPPAQILNQTPKKVGFMDVAMPVTFTGVAGASAVSSLKTPGHTLGTATSYPQTLNTWQTF